MGILYTCPPHGGITASQIARLDEFYVGAHPSAVYQGNFNLEVLYRGRRV